MVAWRSGDYLDKIKNRGDESSMVDEEGKALARNKPWKKEAIHGRLF